MEAARAGEAGKGFAVLADEVRNLAAKSANAARNTENLIARTIENTRNGVSVSRGVTEQLDGMLGPHQYPFGNCVKCLRSQPAAKR